MGQIRTATVGLLVAATLTACGTQSAGAPGTVTVEHTQTVERTVTATQTITTTPAATSSNASVTTASATTADQAACRLIGTAIERSGIQPLADQATAGGMPSFGDVAKSGMRFADLLGVAPTSASRSITDPLTALVVMFQALYKNWTAMPADVNPSEIGTVMSKFPQVLAALEWACN